MQKLTVLLMFTMIRRAEANPRGRPSVNPSYGPKIFSISCSFVENLTKLYVSTPLTANLRSAPARGFIFFILLEYKFRGPYTIYLSFLL